MRAPRLQARLLLDPTHCLALGLGSGLAPWAPGTAGTLVALFPGWWLQRTAFAPSLLIVLAIVAAGIWICGASARKLGVHDHPAIVFDEIAAMLLLSITIPVGPVWLAAAFIVFRFFDIVKPWPIRDMDHRLGGGVGIMLDDLMAALYSAICLWVIEYLLTAI